MKINKNELLQALEVVKAGLSTKGIIEQADCFIFAEGCISTYNDELFVSALFNLDFTGAIKATELYSILPKLSTEEIEWNTTEKEIILKSGKAKAGLSYHSKLALSVDNILGTKGKWKALPTDFLVALKGCSQICSKNTLKPLLTCVHCSNDYLEASNDVRIVRYPLKGFPFENTLIPAHSVGAITSINPTHIAMGSGWVHFINEQDTILSTRIFEDDDYPDCDRFFEISGTKIALPEMSDKIIERASVFSKDLINVRIEKSKTIIRAENSNSWFEEESTTDYKGQDYSFTISPALLQDVVKTSTDCEISDRFLKFKNTNWVYLTLLNSK